MDIVVSTAFFSFLFYYKFPDNREFTGKFVKYCLYLNFFCQCSAAFNPKFPKKITGNYFSLTGKFFTKNSFK